MPYGSQTADGRRQTTVQQADLAGLAVNGRWSVVRLPNKKAPRLDAFLSVEWVFSRYSRRDGLSRLRSRGDCVIATAETFNTRSQSSPLSSLEFEEISSEMSSVVSSRIRGRKETNLAKTNNVNAQPTVA